MRAAARPKHQPHRGWYRVEDRPPRAMRKAQRHGERQRARLAIAAALAMLLVLPAPARGEVPPTTEGRSVDLEAGQPAPFKGTIVDDAYALLIRNRRRAAERAADDAIALVAEKEGELADCRATPVAGLRPSTVAALVATALAVGVVGGVWLGATAAR